MECSICLDTNDDSFLAFPGCGHNFHVLCALRWAQHDLKCPYCRHVPLQSDVEDTKVSSKWRYFARQKNGKKKYKSHLAEVKRIRADILLLIKVTQKIYDEKCDDMWVRDDELRELKRSIAKLERRERRIIAMMVDSSPINRLNRAS